MKLKRLEIAGFKSFNKRQVLDFEVPIVAIVGPNGSGKSNVAEAFRWVLGEQSLKSLRGRRGEDFIWSGQGSKLSRAAVSVIFDNRDKHFALDYDEVKITREVHRDGVNNYFLNESPVRLRDIMELLAAASLGASGYHIINQGEVDRILNAHPLDRRAMVEESLGLRIYHWKLREAEKKLEKTQENLREVSLLRKEISPHLKFLKKEIEKIEKTRELRQELKQRALTYFGQEQARLAGARAALSEREHRPKTRLLEIEKLDQGLAGERELTDIGSALAKLDRELKEIEGRKGRLQGMIELKEKEAAARLPERARLVAWSEVRSRLGALRDLISQNRLIEAVAKLDQWLGEDQAVIPVKLGTDQIEAWRGELEEIEAQRERLGSEQNRWRERERAVLANLKSNYDLKLERNNLQAELVLVNTEREKLDLEEREFNANVEETSLLTDREVLNFHAEPSSLARADYDYDKEKREVERLKIRLEESGAESGDVIKEYENVSVRDAFLEKEIADLTQSIQSIEKVAQDLESKFESEFKGGLAQINVAFQKFFTEMFGGGTASLSFAVPKKFKLEEEGGEADPAGIEIKVNLPRKKIRGLEMLSGGERALTSVALLFAMSQVNPPPFMVLDETDAALDEANSRRYGDMIAALAERSQLILITHNRETMSRAGVIYGVTMGGDGVSQLLSIKFDEAVGYAK